MIDICKLHVGKCPKCRAFRYFWDSHEQCESSNVTFHETLVAIWWLDMDVFDGLLYLFKVPKLGSSWPLKTSLKP